MQSAVACYSCYWWFSPGSRALVGEPLSRDALGGMRPNTRAFSWSLPVFSAIRERAAKRGTRQRGREQSSVHDYPQRCISSAWAGRAALARPRNRGVRAYLRAVLSKRSERRHDREGFATGQLLPRGENSSFLPRSKPRLLVVSDRRSLAEPSLAAETPLFRKACL
jgi:hypothetical protein